MFKYPNDCSYLIVCGIMAELTPPIHLGNSDDMC